MAGTVTAHRTGALAVAMLVSLVAVGCASGTQSQPERLDRDAVPFGLLDEPATTAPPTTVPTEKNAFVVYFVAEDGAVLPVVRTTSEVPRPAEVAVALLAGPTPEEVQVGMSTSIPRRAIGRIGGIAQQTVTIDLNRPFTEVSGATQKNALAQIVLTMTSLRGVARVRFRLDGQPVSVPRLDGSVTRAPVRKSDYQPRVRR